MVTFQLVLIKTLVIYIYCVYACASYSLFVIYLFVLSYLLLIVH
jgi:hypothetical protein